MFQLTEIEDMDQSLTAKILSDPTHKIVKFILYIYSMESFIYRDMFRAIVYKDQSKIKFYGAYAATLSYILYSATQNRSDI